MGIIGGLLGLILIGWLFFLPVYLLCEINRLRERMAALEKNRESRPDYPEAAPPSPPIPREEPAVPPAPAIPIDWESLLGRKWLYWSGILVILLGVAFFLKYAFDNRWFNETARIIIGLAAGALFIGAGERLKGRYRYFALGLYGTGIGILYLSFYTGYNFYRLLPYPAAFLVMAMVTGLSVVLAVRNNSLFLAFVSMLGGFLTPLLLRSENPSLYGLFSYIFLLDTGIFVLTFFKRWRSLAGAGLALTALLLLVWTEHLFTGALFLPATSFLLAFFLLFLAGPVVNALRDDTSDTDYFLIVANAVFVTWFLARFLGAAHPEFKGFAAIFLAGVYLETGLIARRRIPNRDNLILTFLGVALVFLTAAVPLQLHGFPVAMVWAGEAVVLSWMGVRIPSRSARLAAFLLFVIAVLRLGACESAVCRAGFVPIFNQRVLSYAAVTGAIFLSAFITARGRPAVSPEERSLSTIFNVGAQILLFALITSETHYFFTRTAAGQTGGGRETIALTLVWAVYAGLLMLAGRAGNLRSFRYCSLSLFLLTILKVFFVDIAEVELVYRIAGFLGLGLALLLVSFSYHRRKTDS